jgi:hypothetical protein
MRAISVKTKTNIPYKYRPRSFAPSLPDMTLSLIKRSMVKGFSKIMRFEKNDEGGKMTGWEAER